MPIIKLEKKVPISDGVSRIETVEYELPEHIVFEDEYLTHDNYHQAYSNDRKYIKAIDYLNMILAENSSEKDTGEQDKALSR